MVNELVSDNCAEVNKSFFPLDQYRSLTKCPKLCKISQLGRFLHTLHVAEESGDLLAQGS